MKRRTTGRVLLLAAAAFCAYWSTHEIAPASVAPDVMVRPEVTPEDKITSFLMDHPRLVAAGVALLSLLVCCTEPNEVSLSIGGPLEKRGDYFSIVFINSLLSLCSGMMNALAFLECSATIAHHSGNMTHFGRNLGGDAWFPFMCYLIAFLMGGFIVGCFKSDTESIFVGRYSATMMASVICAVGGTVLCLVTGDKLATLVLWAFAQGIQNGLCRKFSSMPLCSTHFTGYLSDAGHFIGGWIRAKVLCETLPDMKKTWLFLSCMFFFAFGGYTAKLGRETYGMLVAFVPAVMMASVAVGLYPLPVARQLPLQDKTR